MIRDESRHQSEHPQKWETIEHVMNVLKDSIEYKNLQEDSDKDRAEEWIQNIRSVASKIFDSFDGREVEIDQIQTYILNEISKQIEMLRNLDVLVSKYSVPISLQIESSDFFTSLPYESKESVRFKIAQLIPRHIEGFFKGGVPEGSLVQVVSGQLLRYLTDFYSE